LDDNVGNNKNVQENVKDRPEVNVKLTVHANKLCSCFEESDNKVNVVADKRTHIKDVVHISKIVFETFNRELNEFIIGFK